MSSRMFPAGEYVALMSHLLDIHLTKSEQVAYCNAVTVIQQAGQRPVDIQNLHRVMLGEDRCAGMYRQGSVIDLRGVKVVKRDFPRHSAIPQLMYSFRRLYENALSGNYTSEVVNIAELAWIVGANGRCLHPFVLGNTRLFLLLENHVRQVYGLPWEVSFQQKQKFSAFRVMYRQRFCEYFD
jgi:hypothetical protein